MTTSPISSPTKLDHHGIDAKIKRLGELQIAIAGIEGDLTVATNALKQQSKDRAAPLVDERKIIESEIKLWAEHNKAQFAKKRSLELQFGKIAYHISHSLSLPRAKDKVQSLISSIKSLGFGECIVREEKPSRELLLELSDTDLVKLGLQRKTTDNLRIEPNIEKIQEA